MASSISKKTDQNRDYWVFYFTSAKKAREGNPRRKYFYYAVDEFRKSDVADIKSAVSILYKKGEWDPWVDPIPKVRRNEPGKKLLQHALDEYYDIIPKELAPSTIRAAKGYLKTLIDSVGNIYITEIKKETLIDWVNGHDSWSTRRSKKYTIQRFLGWCAQKGYIESAWEIEAYSTKEERSEITRESLTEKEFLQLLDGFEQLRVSRTESIHAPINRVNQSIDRCKDMVTVLFYMGLRLEEILHCRAEWVVAGGRFLRIGDLNRWNLKDSFTPKSRKEHDAPIVIPPEVMGIFKKYTSQRSGMYERLFGTRSARRLQKNVKKACEKAFGKDRCKKISPHSLRHSCCSYWLNERGVAVQEVQKLMRHEDIKTTMRYYHPSNEAHFNAFHDTKLSSGGI